MLQCYLQEDNEGFDATALVNNCSVEEAKYLLEHFIQTSIGRVRDKRTTYREEKLEIVKLAFINFNEMGIIVKVSESEIMHGSDINKLIWKLN